MNHVTKLNEKLTENINTVWELAYKVNGYKVNSINFP